MTSPHAAPALDLITALVHKWFVIGRKCETNNRLSPCQNLVRLSHVRLLALSFVSSLTACVVAAQFQILTDYLVKDRILKLPYHVEMTAD